MLFGSLASADAALQLFKQRQSKQPLACPSFTPTTPIGISQFPSPHITSSPSIYDACSLGGPDSIRYIFFLFFLVILVATGRFPMSDATACVCCRFPRRSFATYTRYASELRTSRLHLLAVRPVGTFSRHLDWFYGPTLFQH